MITMLMMLMVRESEVCLHFLAFLRSNLASNNIHVSDRLFWVVPSVTVTTLALLMYIRCVVKNRMKQRRRGNTEITKHCVKNSGTEKSENMPE